MRANVEDTDLSSYKLRLATAYFKESGIQLDIEHAVLGVMVRIWYHAVNEKKKKISLSDLSKYLFIVNQETAEKLAGCLVASEYLIYLPEERMYEIVGKDKDFNQKMENEEMSRMANEAKKKKALEKINKTYDSKRPSAEPSTVPSAVPSTEPPVELLTEPSMVASAEPLAVPHALHNISLQDITLHTIHNTPEILPSPSAPVTKSRSPKVVDEKPTQALKHKYFELYTNKYGAPPAVWGAKENTHAKRLLSSISLERAVELLEFFFDWNNKEAIDGGHSFATGYRCFLIKLEELQADILKPERRITSQMAALQMRRMAQEQQMALDNKRLIEKLEAEQSGRLHEH